MCRQTDGDDEMVYSNSALLPLQIRVKKRIVLNYFAFDHKRQENKLTRRRSESAYVHQENFLQLLYRVGVLGERDGAPLNPVFISSRFQNNRPKRY